MRGLASFRALVGLATLAALLTFVAGASAAGFHGIAFNKGCTGSTPVGQPYTCGYQILNVADTAHDTLRVTSIVDRVFAASGIQTSPNILTAGSSCSAGRVSCVGGSGAGTLASPYVGATSCDLPFNTTITVRPFSFYTVQPADYNINANHTLADQAILTWSDLCNLDTPPVNCPIGNQTAQSGSQTTVTKLASATATDIHNAAHQTVLTVPVGTTVHDFITVTGQAGQPNPTGNVFLEWYTNGTCASPAASSTTVGPLSAAGTFDATGLHVHAERAGPVRVPGALPRRQRVPGLGRAVRAADGGRREHPDHAERRQSRRDDAHLHGARERQRRQRASPTRRTGRRSASRSTPGLGASRRRTRARPRVAPEAARSR